MKESWKKILDLDYFNNVIKNQIKPNEIYPKKAKDNLFKPFSYFNPEDTKVVICFNNPKERIDNWDLFKSSLLIDSCDISMNESNINITKIVKQGVLLLDSTFTSPIKGKSDLHKELWNPFTSQLINELDYLTESIWVFIDCKWDIEHNKNIINTSFKVPQKFKNASIFWKINQLLNKKIEWVCLNN